MDVTHMAVRNALAELGTAAKLDLIRSFCLPPDEERCLIDREVKGKSVQQIADALSLSPETVKRRRKRALTQIARELDI